MTRIEQAVNNPRRERHSMRLLGNPLLQFLALGGLLFVLHGQGRQPRTGEPGQIVVTAGQIESLATTFSRTWQRPPTVQELDGLIEDYIREEVLSREAVALGLDRDDTVIRRRLRQKMEFIGEDLAAEAEPGDAELASYLETHPDAFRREPRLSFSHVYFNADRDEALDRARHGLAELRRGSPDADPSRYGDSFLLARQFSDVTRGEMANTFGEQFAAQVMTLEPGTWQGPVRSGYGFHLILVRERVEGRVPALEEVRDAVHREWANARRLDANEQLYRRLRGQYAIRVELTPEGVATARTAEASR